MKITSVEKFENVGFIILSCFRNSFFFFVYGAWMAPVTGYREYLGIAWV